jgi:transcriptional regulator with GAF, ATPase, and Fis domain
MMAFDVYQAGAGEPDGAPPLQPSLLPLETYLLLLAQQGHLPLEDVLTFESDLLKRTYNAWRASEQALEDSSQKLYQKLAELEAANQVLLKRTEALISLQEMVQLLTASTHLEDLAMRACRRACELCGADRAILYYFHSVETSSPKAEVLAVAGWDKALLRRQFEPQQVFTRRMRPEPSYIKDPPPGVTAEQVKAEGITIQAGMRLPLMAQEQLTGVMLIHSTRKKVFTPGETALLQTFASQAALAIQRAGLIEELRAKIQQRRKSPG